MHSSQTAKFLAHQIFKTLQRLQALGNHPSNIFRQPSVVSQNFALCGNLNKLSDYTHVLLYDVCVNMESVMLFQYA